jgi:outer membrane protein assembly factor BamE (lipoprotein component of BamABCDE complex)
MRLPPLILLAAALAWLSPALAQSSGPGAAPSRAQAERNAVDLKQGMTQDEVQQLLGKPRRTALRGNGGLASTQGTLQWTYVWSGPAPSSSSERSLQIDFAAKAVDQWIVNSWGWSNY